MSPARWAARAAGTAGGAVLFAALVVPAGVALVTGASALWLLALASSYLRGTLRR